MPQAILLYDVESLGERGAVVEVSKGYLRNYLIPRKLAAARQRRRARRGAPARARQPSAPRARRSSRPRRTRRCCRARCSRSPSRPATTAACSARSRAQDIVDAIREARGLQLDRRGVHLEEPIRNVGTYMVVVEVADGVTATIKTIVIGRQVASATARPPVASGLRRRAGRPA